MSEDSLADVIAATNKFRSFASQDDYSKLRNQREKATFTMMMKMNPDALTNIRKEFFSREDSITLDEFIYILQKHLVKGKEEEKYLMVTPDQREFATNMFELFKDIDVNGDGQLEWQEFTTFTVEKANLLNKRAKLTNITHYHDFTNELDPSALYRHRHDISRFVNIPLLGQFAIVEDHRNSIFVFNSRLAKHLATIVTESAPIAIENISERDRSTLVTSGADMTLATYSLDDPNPKRRYKLLSSWATPGVQMALAYSSESHLLYSGGTNGNIYSWNVEERSLETTLVGHTDIVMSLIMLKKLDNIASASLDKTLCIWDSHTNEQLLKLHGHKKGVFDLTYNPTYRLIVSCGFEHDACIWSPFVNSLVYRLKGHHASLVGCQSVENSAEIITADQSGVFKLWDVRNFQCIQTFSANMSGQDLKDSSTLTCFFHTKLPSRNAHQKEDDSRIYAASKNLFAFEQARVVHEATTDYSNVFWTAWNGDSCVIITVSDNNVIVWDALIGSKTFTHANICDEEISACCLDDRKRKMVIGDVKGKIGVYNHSNGALMKTVHNVVHAAVISLQYFDEAKRFIAGYANGVMNAYDENVLEDCHLLFSFEHHNSHPELLNMVFNSLHRCVATAGASSGVARLWDYDSGKCENELKVCMDKESHIVHLTQLLPYPVIVTSDSSANVVIWASKGTKWHGLRLSGFVNVTPAGAALEPIIRVTDDSDIPPRRAVPPDSFIRRSLSKEEMVEVRNSLSTDEQNMFKKYRDLHMILKSRDSFQLMDELFGDHKQKKHKLKSAQNELKESELKWGTAAAAQCICWDPSTFRMFVGDDLGTLRCFDVRDVFDDIDREALLHPQHNGQSLVDHHIQHICRSQDRSPCSALHPVKDQEGAVYLLGRPHDYSAYLGVEFCWAVTAHNDRIISCSTAELGVLTSSAERLVKMWSFDGRPLGTLLQSVPVGVRSRSWDLVIDVDAILSREKEDLDVIVQQVSELVANPDKPDIKSLDFSGMQMGSKAAEFSRSELRQRVEKSSKRLGIDFVIPGSAINTRVNTPNKVPVTGNSPPNKRNVTEESVLNNVENLSLNGSIGNKSLEDALKELKSTEAAVDFDLKSKGMTIIQKKRKQHKLDFISKTFEAKSGIKVQANSLELKGLDARNENEGETDGQGEKRKVDAKVLDFNKLINSHVIDRPPRDEATVNADMYSLSTMKGGGNNSLLRDTPPHKNGMGIEEENDDYPENEMKMGRKGSTMTQMRASTLRRKDNTTITTSSQTTGRTRKTTIQESCSKYTSFQALEDQIWNKSGPLTADIVNELRQKREQKYKDIVPASRKASVGTTHKGQRLSTTLQNAGHHSLTKSQSLSSNSFAGESNPSTERKQSNPLALSHSSTSPGTPIGIRGADILKVEGDFDAVRNSENNHMDATDTGNESVGGDSVDGASLPHPGDEEEKDLQQDDNSENLV